MEIIAKSISQLRSFIRLVIFVFLKFFMKYRDGPGTVNFCYFLLKIRLKILLNPEIPPNCYIFWKTKHNDPGIYKLESIRVFFNYWIQKLLSATLELRSLFMLIGVSNLEMFNNCLIGLTNSVNLVIFNSKVDLKKQIIEKLECSPISKFLIPRST